MLMSNKVIIHKRFYSNNTKNFINKIKTNMSQVKDNIVIDKFKSNMFKLKDDIVNNKLKDIISQNIIKTNIETQKSNIKKIIIKIVLLTIILIFIFKFCNKGIDVLIDKIFNE